MKRPVKKTTTAQKEFDIDVRLETLEAIVSMANGQIGECIDDLRKGTADLNQRLDTLESAEEPAPPSPAEFNATEDMLVGLWVSEQTAEGKTTVDLSIVEHIRTGIRLALQQ
jgi:hypothetical protein